MAWVKLDDGFFRHPKVVGAGRDARVLYLAGLCYCGANLTDGSILDGALRVLAAEAEIKNPKAAAERLVEVGLWEQVGGGYRVHDYLDHNRSSDNVRSERDAAADRMRRGRSENVRPNKARSSPEVRITDTDTDTEREREKNDDATPAPPGAAAPSPSAPYRLFQAFCEETGADEAAAGEGTKAKQCAVAKRLLADGVDEPELRRAVRWLGSQAWRTSPIDLRTVESEIGKWRLAGRPEREQSAHAAANGRASPAAIDWTAAREAQDERRRAGAT